MAKWARSGVASMRAWAIALIVALLASMLVAGPRPVQAQQLDGLEVLAERTGDLGARGGTATQAWAAPHFEALDLVSLTVAEGPVDISFRLKVASLAPPGEMYVTDDGAYSVRFTHNDQVYAAEARRSLAEQVYTWGFLLKYDPDAQVFNYQRDFAVAQDAAENVLTWAIARQDLTDSEGAAPFPGRSLTGFVAEAHMRSSQDPFLQINDQQPTREVDVFDRMPDSAEGTVPLPITLGLQQSGHAALWSPQPMRASNGEATSFVFEVRAGNTGPDEDLFELIPSGIPRGWEVVIPDRFLRLAGGAALSVPVVVSTPFSHDHGTVQDFRLELHSQSDVNSVGRLQLGIRYHAVPQPAGHHDMLYFHSHRWGEDHPLFVITESISSGNSGLSYLNSAEEDQEDQEVSIKGTYWGWGCHDPCVPDPPKAVWRWATYLQPGLEMGLDFDLSRKGSLTFPVMSATPIAQAILDGKLLHWTFNEATQQWVAVTVAEFAAGAPVDLVPNQPHTFQFEVTPTPEAELLPNAERVRFGLEMNLSSLARLPVPGFTGVEAPELLPGGWMQLPLFEYRDPIGDAFASVSDLTWIDQELHTMANPGETALFTAALHSDVDRDVDVELDLAGVHADWADLLHGKAFRIPAGGHLEVPIAVRVPGDAPDGDAADIVVTAQALGEPALRSLLRLVAVVDTDSDHEDASAAAAAQTKADAKESPVPPGLVIVAIALATLAMRRRR